MLPRHTTKTNGEDDDDDVDDEYAGDDDDDAPTLEHGEEGRPRRNKPALSQDAAVSARPGAGQTNDTEIRPEIAFSSLSLLKLTQPFFLTDKRAPQYTNNIVCYVF